MLDTLVDLGKVTTDSYVVAGIADHLCRWESCYQTIQLLLIPHSQLHIYHGGHLGILTQADELAPFIDTFLDGHSPDRASMDEENPG